MHTSPSVRLGIDVGGTNIRAAIVETSNGSLASEVQTVDTPPGATPERVGLIADVLRAELGYDGPTGCALPGVVEDDRLKRATNLAESWAGKDALQSLRRRLGRDTVLLNDADAVGLAELRYGPDAHTSGLTIVLTFGTGIGSALLFEGRLIPNAELGEVTGPTGSFEHTASGRTISDEQLDPDQWARRAQPYFDHLDRLLNPSRWVVAGGLSQSFDDYFALISLNHPIRVAHLGHHAGIVGAAAATIITPSPPRSGAPR